MGQELPLERSGHKGQMRPEKWRLGSLLPGNSRFQELSCAPRNFIHGFAARRVAT